MSEFNIDRDRLIAVVRYPQQGDPLAVSYAIAEAEAGNETQITVFDPFSREIEESYQIPLAPGIILSALEEGNVEPSDVKSMEGVELYNGYDAEQPDRSDYLPDDIVENDNDLGATFTTANNIDDNDDSYSENSR
ncbi:hypothetical protein [Halorubrum aidingense]|uniref:hypothetical protein n=1 Tax=Halorubrum aidingense TaxID=368623 RepID=UPI001266EC8A|nr:hypothetical protein [Halorubrum aidingense]